MKKTDYWNTYRALKFHNSETEKFMLEPFGTVASNFITDSDAFINLAVGSIRSGKTIAAIITFLRFIQESPHSRFAMAGKTLGSLTRNVLDPMKGILRYYNISYDHRKFDKELDLIIGGRKKTIVLYGIEKRGADEPIRGSTYAGCLLDEVTVMDDEGVRMMISRNSLPGSKIFMTCNPTNPNNFIHQEYVCNENGIKAGEIKVTNFLLEDNQSLSSEYIRHVKSIYPEDSVFYKRNIQGMWVSGQGLIFDSFNTNNIFSGEVDLDYYDYLEIGSDYGTSTTTCYSLVGINEFDDHNEFDVICESGHDATRLNCSQTDVERVHDIIRLQDEYHLDDCNMFYPSHDAGSLKAALEKTPEFIMDLQTFTPNTLECIQEMSSLFYQNYLRIHESCTETIQQLHGYEWDSKAAQRGEDKPVKKDDHYIDSMRAPIMNHLYGMDNQLLGGLIYL